MRIFNRGPVLSANTVVGLTSTGRQRAESFSENGPRFDVLIALQHGEMSVRDLAKEINLPVDDTKRIVLKMTGMVRLQDVGI